MFKIGYGLISKEIAIQYAQAVCDVLGHGKFNTAKALLIETACAETLLGTYFDPTEKSAGTGLTQVDESTFVWLKDKYTGTKAEADLKANFGFSLNKVEYIELAMSPLLAFVFCRLRYRTVRAEIPATLEERAEYWKLWYNSVDGKGTAEEYIKRSNDCFYKGI